MAIMPFVCGYGVKKSLSVIIFSNVGKICRYILRKKIRKG